MENDRGLALLVDRRTVARGMIHASRGLATPVEAIAGAGEAVGVVRGSDPHICYQTTATYELDPVGTVTAFDSWCTCPVQASCEHAVALLFTTFAQRTATLRPVNANTAARDWSAGADDVSVRHPKDRRHPWDPQRDDGLFEAPGRNRLAVVRPAERPAWELALADLVVVDQPDAMTATEPLALLFELVPPGPMGAGGPHRYSPAGHPGHLAVRPARLGQRGTWVRTGGVSWSDLRYGLGHSRFREGQLRILTAIGQLSATGNSYYYYRSSEAWLQLSTLNTPALWTLLNQAVDQGVSLVSDQPGQPPIKLSEAPAEIILEVDRDAAGLQMIPTVAVGGAPVPRERCMFLGEPAHGLVTWSGNLNGRPAQITLAALDRPADPSVRKLFAAGGVRVPAADESRFLHLYIPELRRRHQVRAVSEIVQLSEERPPVLTLGVRPLAGHRVELEWEWCYRVGDSERRMGLQPGPADEGRRDHVRERRILAEIMPLLEKVAHLAQPNSFGVAPMAHAVTGGWDTIDLVTTILPMLQQHPDVEVELFDGLQDYRPAAEEPVIELSSRPAADSTDWFDLTVVVTLDGEQIPFEQLFRALATNQDVMILADGTYFSLDREEFRQLRVLIEEARSLQDRPDGPLRISRFQAALWEELEKLGVVDAQSSQWLTRVRGWRSPEGELPAPPETLNAQLRTYQLDGYRWLNLLRENELGGILADDMGLGKTIQALAMIARARELDPDGPPFLVVAPTSVVGNWQAEAVRFLPGAKTLVIGETEVRRGIPLAAAVDGMDIVITSYTLFRLEFDHYQTIDFAGLIMDEAQALKNHQSKAFGCAKRLSVPVKFAITGTPMENNLTELWALFSLVAPGLFPSSPARFQEYYRIPIERGGEQELLARLRRRIRPLMLRRTKEEVAIDLPLKQEQVLAVELEPAHRRIYQRHLQRERQKVLGLLGDLEKNRFAIFRSLMLLRQASIDPFLIDPKNAEVGSTKLNVLLDLLADVVAGGHRTLIFSQFTGFLARVRSRLDRDGIEYCYLAGATRNRPAVIDEFRTGSASVFLISLKAGGVGLNLVEADYCILLDPWWNPATEAQAVDRTHRIGQTKNVMVYRLVSKDTIEEKVMALKESKAKLFDSVMSTDGGGVHAGGGGGGKAISAADIRELLG